MRSTTTYVEQILKKWDVGLIFYGIGDPDAPKLVSKCELSKFWEYQNIKD